MSHSPMADRPSHASLVPFNPMIRKWFEEQLGSPTRAQQSAWPAIALGQNVIVTAPTGSGKTLTAFLFAIDQLVSCKWSTGGVRVLYVSPLRALNNDIRRNLLAPLTGIAAVFREAGETMPDIRVQTRSGDTPATERRAMMRHPPEILITTPESLNILLLSGRAIDLFAGLHTVILDEIHAVAGVKRGTHLMTAVERLTRIAGDFQRIALSATVHPIERIARFVGGFRLVGEGESVRYEPRSVVVVDAGETKKYDLRVCFRTFEALPPEEEASHAENPIWRAVADEMAHRVVSNRATLVFANSRRGVERMARLINAAQGEGLVYAHHGSLSREIREVVEARLKEGAIKGVVATSSLELGIDIGAVDEVLMLETPPSMAAMIQRLGRAGHGVGATSCGKLYPLHGQDVVNAAVMACALDERAVEPIIPPSNPLDVLAQVLLAMTAVEPWPLDALYDFIRTCDMYRHLHRRLFDRVIDMLAGKYQESRLPVLKPRLLVDRMDGVVRALPGVTRLLYSAGGTIPDRGYYRLRIGESGAVIGELDEEFVWERKRGDIITLGVQSWRVVDIGANDVTVSFSGSRTADQPFWTCEEQASCFDFAARRGAFIEEVEPLLDNPAFLNILDKKHHLDQAAATALVRFLKSQQRALGCGLAHRHHMVIENTSQSDKARMPLTIIHNEWGGEVNRPFSMALAKAIEEKTGNAIQVVHDDQCVALASQAPLFAGDLLALVTSENAARLVRAALASTGFFGARFRENAGRALLLPRAGFGRRTPLWLIRQRAKDLFTALSGFEDFPIMLETYRACLQDEMALPVLEALLDEVASQRIAVSEVTTAAPSPFAKEVLWKLTSALMYEDDQPPIGAPGMGPALIDEVVFSQVLRPRIGAALVTLLELKLQRTFPGYAPRDETDLMAWVKERRLIPAEEWPCLLAAMVRDHGVEEEEIRARLDTRMAGVCACSGGKVLFFATIEDIPAIIIGLGWTGMPPLVSVARDGEGLTQTAMEGLAHIAPSLYKASPADEDPLASLLSEWLRFYGPITPARLLLLLCVEASRLQTALSALAREEVVVIDRLTEAGASEEVCAAENLRRLLRMAKNERQESFTPLPVEEWPGFLAAWQGLGGEGEKGALEDRLEKLFGYGADARLWEEEILPARLRAYRSDWVDDLLRGTILEWQGVDKGKIALLLSDDRELFSDAIAPEDRALADALFPSTSGRYSESDLILSTSVHSQSDLASKLWYLVWKGVLSSDTFDKVRKGVASGFRVHPVPMSKPRPFRGARQGRWQKGMVETSTWYRLCPVEHAEDALEQEVLNRDRARVLLDRYGVLFRELLERETPALRWRTLFRTLRILELTGEVVGGYFLDGVSGVQFASPEALKRLKSDRAPDTIYWMNAADPASPCGLGIERLEMPHRVASIHLVFHGNRLVLTSRRRGRLLDIRVTPDDPYVKSYLGFLEALLTREVNPLKAIAIEEINRCPAATSPFRSHFEALFDTTADHRALRISRRF